MNAKLQYFLKRCLKFWYVAAALLIVPMVAGMLFFMLTADNAVYSNTAAVRFEVRATLKPEVSADKTTSFSSGDQEMVLNSLQELANSTDVLAEINKSEGVAEYEFSDKELRELLGFARQGGVIFITASHKDKALTVSILNAFIAKGVPVLVTGASSPNSDYNVAITPTTHTKPDENPEVESGASAILTGLLAGLVVGIVLVLLVMALPFYYSGKMYVLSDLEEVFKGKIFGDLGGLSAKLDLALDKSIKTVAIAKIGKNDKKIAEGLHGERAYFDAAGFLENDAEIERVANAGGVLIAVSEGASKEELKNALMVLETTKAKVIGAVFVKA